MTVLCNLGSATAAKIPIIKIIKISSIIVNAFIINNLVYSAIQSRSNYFFLNPIPKNRGMGTVKMLGAS